jgi:RimJ/RimL family protein N-acetyltransferase
MEQGQFLRRLAAGARRSRVPSRASNLSNLTRFQNGARWTMVTQIAHGTPIMSKPLVPGHIEIHSENYLVRTVTVDDSSDRWGEWMADPGVTQMMNMPVRHWTKSDVADYIRQFDQQTRLLLGTFAKRTSGHIGIVTIELRPAPGEFLVTMLVGEPDYRNKGVATEITRPFRDYVFETLGLTTMRAAVLANNAVIQHYMRRTGCKLDGTGKGYARSRSDGGRLDLCLYSLTRDEWRAWKARNLNSTLATVGTASVDTKRSGAA